MNRSSVAQYGGNTSPILATVDMEMNRRLSQQQQGNGNTANNTSNVAAVAAGPEPQKKREITQKDAIKILSKLRPVKRRTFLLNLISGLLSGYNWFGTYIWTYSTLSSYLDYTLVTQIDQGSLALYQVPGCSNYISNHEIQNTTYAQIRNYDSSCPYNFCVVNLQDCSLNTAYQYRFPTRFSDNTNPAQCNQRNLSALATVICTFTTLPGYTGTVSKSRSVCVFADPATTAYGVGSTVKLTEYFTNYAKVNSIDSQLEISCQMRDANSTDASNPFETTERSVNYLLLIILVSIVAGIIVIKELFKSTVLLMSLCYARFRQPGYFILTLDSPLIIPFCFSDFYLALMLASKRVNFDYLIPLITKITDCFSVESATGSTGVDGFRI
jgi:hypothetical protein